MGSVPSTQRVQTRGLRFQYRQQGQGEPVILLHGFPQTSHCWTRFMQVGGEDFAFFAPDTRGFGGTDKPRHRVTLDLLARDLIDFMDALGLEQATVIGHDYGGMIATAAALEYPERISRLLLIDCTTSIFLPWAAHGYWVKVPGLAERFFERHHEAFLDAIFRGGDVEMPGMPEGPFPAARAFPKQSWCDPEALRDYQESYRDPDSQWSAIAYYRDALPFHRLTRRGYELIEPAEIEALWTCEGGYFSHPSFGEFHAFAPERLGQRYPGPTSFLYTATTVPAAFPISPEVAAGAVPTEGNPAAAATVAHFPRLRGFPFESSHFIPEEKPERLAEILRTAFEADRA